MEGRSAVSPHALRPGADVRRPDPPGRGAALADELSLRPLGRALVSSRRARVVKPWVSVCDPTPAGPEASVSGNEQISLGFAGLHASPGAHVGHFYSSKKECRDFLVPFVQTGLERGDKCVCVMSPGAYFQRCNCSI